MEACCVLAGTSGRVQKRPGSSTEDRAFLPLSAIVNEVLSANEAYVELFGDTDKLLEVPEATEADKAG